MTRTVDVAIVGGGLAANLLARQLRRHAPKLSVAIFERETTRSYKVGESTVEIASNYFNRRLGLNTYLYDQHLPKNGLRFFFDRETKDAQLPELSEIGLAGLPPYPSFQLDRASVGGRNSEQGQPDVGASRADQPGKTEHFARSQLEGDVMKRTLTPQVAHRQPHRSRHPPFTVKQFLHFTPDHLADG